MMKMIPKLAIATLVLTMPVLVTGHGLVRREEPGTQVVKAVAVPANAEMLFLAAVLPDVADPNAPPGSQERWGNMATQARSVLDKIEVDLAVAGYSRSDIVKMDVYVVGDSTRGGAVDYMGLTSAYLAHFGKDPQDIPLRTTVRVEGMSVPGVLVQIAVTAARTNHSTGG
jgi:enamine deaminase RidA (YjgF/YER057c/UK114 family)